MRQFITDTTGITAMEYGLIASLACIIAIAAMTATGNSVSGTLYAFVTAIDDAI